jgi:hypothetical protein
MGAGVAEEIVARQDVVDLEAFATDEPLADVTLKQGVVVDEIFSLPVTQGVLARQAAARLTGIWRGHE